MKEVYFASTNIYKIEEAQNIFINTDIKIKPVNLDLFEIQSENQAEISAHKANQAYEELNKPIIVDEAGLFIESLSGFPGTMTSQTASTIGASGIFKLINDQELAYFKSVVTYKDSDKTITVEGKIKGTINKNLDPDNIKLFSDFFYPINESSNLSDLTKEGFESHRKKALMKLLEKLTQ